MYKQKQNVDKSVLLVGIKYWQDYFKKHQKSQSEFDIPLFLKLVPNELWSDEMTDHKMHIIQEAKRIMESKLGDKQLKSDMFVDRLKEFEVIRVICLCNTYLLEKKKLKKRNAIQTSLNCLKKDIYATHKRSAKLQEKLVLMNQPLNCFTATNNLIQETRRWMCVTAEIHWKQDIHYCPWEHLCKELDKKLVDTVEYVCDNLEIYHSIWYALDCKAIIIVKKFGDDWIFNVFYHITAPLRTTHRSTWTWVFSFKFLVNYVKQRDVVFDIADQSKTHYYGVSCPTLLNSYADVVEDTSPPATTIAMCYFLYLLFSR
ncbi:hypothetical protein RFI_10257 [Reticulomyxa filosa]|uniref:Uncharacterized protein n=1 Tax=Reticulomyxa filosa TaxID=46433 RepID=X6NMH6_RETFI|nr:hypothetical protein RFI_10257 [Reticulomyxa filosa]|eukprot:ETO26874.1 hypothetical protein RFI_10257 [Reticulomyxa filosa]